MIRTFIAVEFPEPIKEKISRDIDLLRQAAPLVRWSQPENLHLTARFLGDVKENDLEELFDAVEDAVAEIEPFVLEICGVGAFPNWRYPRVIWAGVKEGAEEAKHLAGLVESACMELGYEKERRPFRPHLTLGRVKEPAHAFGLHTAAHMMEEKEFGIVDVDEIVVFMSTLRRTGPVYSPMVRLPLSGE